MFTLIISDKHNCSSKQMKMIKEKCLIHHLIDSIKGKIYILLSAENNNSIEYINNNFKEKVNIIKISKYNENYQNLPLSIEYALSKIKEDTRTCNIVLGNILCDKIPKGDNNFIISYKHNPNFNNFIEKVTSNNVKNKKDLSLSGFCRISDIKLFKELLNKEIKNKNFSITGILNNYNDINKFRVYSLESCFDLDDNKAINDFSNYYFNVRNFNSLSVNKFFGSIIKTSNKIEKIEDEYFWYKNIPDEIQHFTPKPYSIKKDSDKISLELEMYAYPPISELFVTNKLSSYHLNCIIHKLFEINQLFYQYQIDLSIEDKEYLYKNKTNDRINDLIIQNKLWNDIFNYDYIFINGTRYENFILLKNKIDMQIEKIINNFKPSIMHGDFCFSNILYDKKTSIVKIIDPRGRLKNRTIYGDARYDIAKLSHSICSKYDFINYFKIEVDRLDNSFNYQEIDKLNKNHIKIFEKYLSQYNYDKFEIYFIEALLFLTMIPLHSDNLNKQKLFYLKSIQKFNQLLN